MPKRTNSASSSPTSKRRSAKPSKNSRPGCGILEGIKQALAHARGEIELPTRYIHVVPDVNVRVIREAQGLTREEFAERYGLSPRSVQEWEQGRRKPESAVRAYMLVIKNQPAAVRKALTAA